MRYKYIDKNTRIKKCFTMNRYKLQRKEMNILGFYVWKTKAWTFFSINKNLKDALDLMLWKEDQKKQPTSYF